MYQVATRFWNEIAATQVLKTEWAKVLFAMNSEEMLEALDAQANALETRGIPNAVILAYQQMAPLLVENDAISRYIVATENLSLRAAMPEVATVDEAVYLAAAERSLNQEQARILASLLEALVSWPSAPRMPDSEPDSSPISANVGPMVGSVFSDPERQASAERIKAVVMKTLERLRERQQSRWQSPQTKRDARADDDRDPL